MTPAMSATKLSDRSPLFQSALWALLVSCIARFWLVPLSSSFWVDELVTAFVVRNPGHPSFAVAPQVPASIYYWLPRIAQRLFGQSEVVYRMPSVLAMGAALFLIARIAVRLINPNAAWFAVFACLGLRGINYQADDARPYALGICVASAAILFLIRWLDTSHWLDAVLFIVFGALLWPIHLIYWPFYIVCGFYAALRILRKETSVSYGRAILIFGLLCAALIPTALEALFVLRGAGSHVIVRLPGPREFEHAVRWSLVLICGGGAWLLARLLHWPAPQKRPDKSSLFLIALWWLCQPISLYLFSHITGNSVFIDRYLSLALPGMALMATAAAAASVPEACWRRTSVALGIGVLIMTGKWTIASPRHDNSDWRAAAREENRLAVSPDTPVIVLSPFVEGRLPAWSPDYPLPGFLYSHLDYYPLKGKIYLLPFGRSPEDGENYAASLTRDVLSRSSRFVIYGANLFWREWFESRPELRGWQSKLEKFGDIEVAVFDRPR